MTWNLDDEGRSPAPPDDLVALLEPRGRSLAKVSEIHCWRCGRPGARRRSWRELRHARKPGKRQYVDRGGTLCDACHRKVRWGIGE